MSDHHRYYKDSYGSSSSKRYHSPSEPPPRMGMSSNDYYDSSDSRSKRSRNDSYGAHTSSSRYAEYSASSSSSSSGRYKTASSSSYYDMPGYKPSSSSSAASSSKYVDDYKGSGSSSRSAPKSNVRRIPPPLTPPSLSSSKSSSSLRLQPLMKVSLSSSNSGVGSAKDYYGSRMRQAPPEHHYSYSGNHGSSTYGKSDFKRPPSYGKAMPSSANNYHSSRAHGTGGSVGYRPSTVASRRLLARSRVPPSSAIASRAKAQARSSMMSSRRDDEIRRRKMASARRNDYKSHSRSESRGSDDRSGKRSSSKDKKEKEEENDKGQRKEEKERSDDKVDFSSIADGQIIIEDVAGDDDEDVEDGNQSTELNSSTDKNSSANADGAQKDAQSNADEEKSEEKSGKDGGTSSEVEKPSATRALLKLHCPYCEVRCISFREFSFHLRSSGHTRVMQNAVNEFKRKLIKIRHDMKEDQRKREKEEKVLSDTQSFCRVCELNFRTDPKEHESNEIHNKIKALIYRRCDVCDIDFRIWKVHIYHMAALEHAKRVAMKELQEREAAGDNVKGTNLSPQELGLNLIEIRTVFYCNACIRYIPIKGDEEEAKRNHCLTLNHLKSVEDYNEREKRRAVREEMRERARRRKQEEQDKAAKAKEGENTQGDKTGEGNERNEDTTETENWDADGKKGGKDGVGGAAADAETKRDAQDNEKSDEEEADKNDESESNMNTSSNTVENDTEETKSGAENVTGREGKENNQNEAEEDDDDEIELHAGEDVVEDESEDAGDWSRRTRSSQRGDGSSK